MTAASAFLPGLDGAAVAHCDGGPRGHPGAALGPTHSFSLFYLSPFVDPTAGERKARFCPVPLPPTARMPLPASPGVRGSPSFPLPSLGLCPSFLSPSHSPSPSAQPPLHPNPKRGDLQRPAPPGWRGGGCRQAPPASLYSVQSPGVWRGRAPSPCPRPQRPSPALPARGFGTCWGQRGPLAAPPRPRLRCRGDPGLPPLYTYINITRGINQKLHVTSAVSCLVGRARAAEAPRSRRAAPLPSHGASPHALLPSPLSPPPPQPIPHRSVLPSCQPGGQEHLCNVALARDRQ